MKLTFAQILLFLMLLFSACSKNNWKETDWTLPLILERASVNKVDLLESTAPTSHEIDVDYSPSVGKKFKFQKTDLYDPIIYERELNHFEPMFIEYYFNRNDTLLSLVKIEWMKDKFYGNHFKSSGRVDALVEVEEVEKYNDEYNRIKNELISKLENPKLQDSKPKLIKSRNNSVKYKRKTEWQKNNLTALLTMEIKASFSQITLEYYWKNEN